MPARS